MFPSARDAPLGSSPLLTGTPALARLSSLHFSSTSLVPHTDSRLHFLPRSLIFFFFPALTHTFSVVPAATKKKKNPNSNLLCFVIHSFETVFICHFIWHLQVRVKKVTCPISEQGVLQPSSHQPMKPPPAVHPAGIQEGEKRILAPDS